MQLMIDALKEAAAWPGADQRTLIVLASQLMAAGLHQEGFDYFAARSDAAPADALSLALAGAFESRLDGRTEQAIARLDAATGLDLGLPHYFRGTSLARLPRCAGRAETVAADLEFVLAVKDQFPPGLLRAAYEGLSHAYESLGRTQEETRTPGRRPSGTSCPAAAAIAPRSHRTISSASPRRWPPAESSSWSPRSPEARPTTA